MSGDRFDNHGEGEAALAWLGCLVRGSEVVVGSSPQGVRAKPGPPKVTGERVSCSAPALAVPNSEGPGIVGGVS